MAVSGRKIDGFKNSRSISSAEDFDIYCDPCQHLGRSVEAKGFCVNCQENLCKRCVEAHKGLKLCRHHSISDQPQKVTQKKITVTDDPRVCTEYCHIHKKEIIKFFCQQHDKVGCSDCMTLDHRTCRIDYIPDICSGTLKGKEFGGMLHMISATINEVDSVVTICQGKKYENKTNTEALLKNIEIFQKKIKDRIERLKQQLVKEANSHKLKRDQDVDKIADTCAGVSSELRQIHSVLQDCQAKKLDAKAFVTMKRALSSLSTINIQNYKDKVNNVLTNIMFVPNDKLEGILTRPDAIGRISVKGLHIDKTIKPGIKTEKETNFDLYSIEQMNKIEVKTKSDKKSCRITGCAVTSADILLLADCNNHKLKVVNIDRYSVLEEMGLETYPWDITVLHQDQAAVTLPNKKAILILGTAGKLSRFRSLQVGRNCYRIVYHHDHLYIICEHPNSLLVLNMRGNIQTDIELNAALDMTFFAPSYIAVGKDGQTLYISDWKSDLVASLTLQGQVTGVYKHDELRAPRGMVLLQDGALLVCCSGSGTIHYVSADLKQGCTLTAGVLDARSICYHAGNSQIYVGSIECNQITVFRIQ